MKKIILSFILFSMAIIASGQSGAIYLCNNCTYKISNGQTITLNEDGSVKKNGKFAQDFKCENVDGEVTIFFKDKPVNTLKFVDDGKCTLKDKKTNLCYSLVSCKPTEQKEEVVNNDEIFFNRLKAIINLKNLAAIKQKFGTAKVQKVESDIYVAGDIVPDEYVVFKGTDNEFSVLLNEDGVQAFILRESYKGDMFPTPLKPGLSLQELYRYNDGKKFSFNAFLSNLNWYGGFFSNECFEVKLSTGEGEQGNLKFTEEFSTGLFDEIFYDNPKIKKYNIKMSRIIFWKCKGY